MTLSTFMHDFAPWLSTIVAVILFYIATRRDVRRNAQQEAVQIQNLILATARIEKTLEGLVSKELCNIVHDGVESAVLHVEKRVGSLERRVHHNSVSIERIAGHVDVRLPSFRDGSDDGEK